MIRSDAEIRDGYAFSRQTREHSSMELRRTARMPTVFIHSWWKLTTRHESVDPEEEKKREKGERRKKREEEKKRRREEEDERRG